MSSFPCLNKIQDFLKKIGSSNSQLQFFVEEDIIMVVATQKNSILFFSNEENFFREITLPMSIKNIEYSAERK